MTHLKETQLMQVRMRQRGLHRDPSSPITQDGRPLNRLQRRQVAAATRCRFSKAYEGIGGNS